MEPIERKIAQEVQKFGGRVFYVGGCVRDGLLGVPYKDIDVEVHGITPDQLKNILAQFGEVKAQGISFGIYSIKGYDLDIAMPRSEKATGRGHRDFEVYVDPFIGTEKAAERRDFTINALMKDVITGEIVDHFGGQDDLKNKIIRHVNDLSFQEDPLRVLRAARFAAKFGFEIAPETLALMQKMDISALSKERVFEELQKALKTEHPSVFFRVLRQVDHLKFWFPEIQKLIGCEQNALYHPEGDVFEHTMQVVDHGVMFKNKTVAPEYFMLATLCHDFGKPGTLDINMHNLGHDVLGADIAEQFIRRFTGDKHMIKYVKNIVRHHMTLPKLFRHDSRNKKTNAFFDKILDLNGIIYMSISDRMFRPGTMADGYKEFEKWALQRAEEYKRVAEQELVSGADLIALGMEPSPRFTEFLAEAHKLQLSYNSKDQIMGVLRKKARSV